MRWKTTDENTNFSLKENNHEEVDHDEGHEEMDHHEGHGEEEDHHRVQ